MHMLQCGVFKDLQWDGQQKGKELSTTDVRTQRKHSTLFSVHFTNLISEYIINKRKKKVQQLVCVCQLWDC